MKRISRRSFLESCGKGVSAALLGQAVLASTLPQRVLGANDRINIALIGCGGRGNVVARYFVEHGARVLYFCDLHEERLANTAKFISQVQAEPVKQCKDMREVFDCKDVDAVIVATPDHWHAPATVMACQAQKDVYVEKPHSHNIWEGRKMVEAARKYKRIVQVGTQNRSGAYNHSARQYVESRKLGKIHLVKVYNLKPGSAFHLGPAGPVPAGFNWDAWLGPAPVRPWHQHIFHGGWHHFWDFSGGDLADDGVHQIDLAMMMMSDPAMPMAVAGTGGRLAHAGDDSEVPDVLVVTYDFDDFVMTFEHSNYPRYMQKTTGTIRRNDEFPYWTQNATRVELYGSEMMMTIGRHGGGYQVTTSGGKVVEQMYGRPCDDEHVQNFLDCVVNRKLPNADIETIHPSCSLIHLANISHRVGNRKLFFNADRETFIDNADANKLLKKDYRENYRIPEEV
jgi:predicted dehydrogenase